jgi:lipid A 3-O-deacylase
MLAATRGAAQLQQVAGRDSVTRLFKVSEDNDGINFYGHPTDDAYTNGTRLDLFYTPAHRPHGLLGKLAPSAGDGSIDIYGWGLMQLMYTPYDISQTAYQPSDYPYSGAIVATHTRYSYNPEKKYDWQTELVMGALGPLSLAHQTQSVVHHLTGFDQPMGWNTQFHNAILLNLNLTAEKQLLEAGSALRVIGGAQVYAGTMQNGAALYPLILVGKMNPYFNGLFSQYAAGHDAAGRGRWQVYFMAKPQLQYYLTNALLQGGIFTNNPNIQKPGDGKPQPSQQQVQSQAQQQATYYAPPTAAPSLKRWIGSVSYGGVISHGNASISFTETVSAATLNGLYCHDVGNISLYFGW